MAQTKKTENFKGMKKDELLKQLSLLREEIRKDKFKAEGSKSKNVKELSQLRKRVARVLTEINKNNTKK